MATVRSNTGSAEVTTLCHTWLRPSSSIPRHICPSHTCRGDDAPLRDKSLLRNHETSRDCRSLCSSSQLVGLEPAEVQGRGSFAENDDHCGMESPVKHETAWLTSGTEGVAQGIVCCTEGLDMSGSRQEDCSAKKEENPAVLPSCRERDCPLWQVHKQPQPPRPQQVPAHAVPQPRARRICRMGRFAQP